jgi:hypothetical protein
VHGGHPLSGARPAGKSRRTTAGAGARQCDPFTNKNIQRGKFYLQSPYVGRRFSLQMSLTVHELDRLPLETPFQVHVFIGLSMNI